MNFDEYETYERQDAMFADPDPEKGGVWRAPTTEELREIRKQVNDQAVANSHIAVIDGFQTSTPGYSGPLAILVGDDDRIRVELDGFHG